MKATEKIKAIQAILGVKQDGDIGKATRNAFDLLDEQGNVELAGSKNEPPGVIHNCKASSFADPEDVMAFNRCKARGFTDLHCFAQGDNGIGQFGARTAQSVAPMVAIHGNDMVAKWGSIQGAAHKKVKVKVGGVEIEALCEDRISAPGRIDLNPAACKVLGLSIPVDPDSTDAEWMWIE